MRPAPRLGARRPAGDSAGFTLVEVLVAMILLLLALALSAQLLLESQRRFLLVGREAQDLLVSPAVEQIREDIRSSSRGVVYPGTGSEPDALLLRGSPVGDVRYEVIEEDLLRIVIDSRSRVISSRPVLRRVKGAQWSSRSGRLFTLELTYERHRTLHARAISSPRPRAFAATEETLAITVFQRGRSNLNRW